jgi:hypothetical protein
MSFETDFVTLLKTVTPVIYADVTPDVAAPLFGVFQQIGGEAYAYIEKKLPDHKHSRMQVSFWGNSRATVNALARAAEKVIIESAYPSEAYGAFTALYEPLIKKYGTRQDFGIWYLDP